MKQQPRMSTNKHEIIKGGEKIRFCSLKSTQMKTTVFNNNNNNTV